MTEQERKVFDGMKEILEGFVEYEENTDWEHTDGVTVQECKDDGPWGTGCLYHQSTEILIDVEELV